MSHNYYGPEVKVECLEGISTITFAMKYGGRYMMVIWLVHFDYNSTMSQQSRVSCIGIALFISLFFYVELNVHSL